MKTVQHLIYCCLSADRQFMMVNRYDANMYTLCSGKKTANPQA